MKPTTVVPSEDWVQPTSDHGARRWRQGYVLVSGIVALAVLFQVFLAGSGLFVGPSWWPMHETLGMLLALGPLALLALGFAARLSGRVLWLTGLLFVLVGIQPVLINAAGLKAFHVVNALLIFGLTVLLGQQVLQRLTQPVTQANERLAR